MGEIEKKIREAIAYKERGYLDLAREILEEIPSRKKDALTFFQEGDLFMKIARRKRSEISPLEYKVLLQRAIKCFRSCQKRDKGELYRFQDKKGNIKYLTLSTLANERIKILQQEIQNLKGIREKEELVRVGPLQWSEGTLLVVKPLKKK
ncbi:MAG: hypothetical protein DRJ34_04050 [Thermoprotei archaeon]|nr:MAG: hypothetical protein DRJ34_04050 [Thermoprotei archaeon]